MDEMRDVTFGQLAREVSAKMAHARMGALSKLYLDEYIAKGRKISVSLHTPFDEEVAECLSALEALYDSGVEAALERVRAQRAHAGKGDNSADVLDALIKTIEGLKKAPPEPPK